LTVDFKHETMASVRDVSRENETTRL